MEETTGVLDIESNSEMINIVTEQDESSKKKFNYLENDDSSDVDGTPKRSIRKRIQQFSDSDVEKENKNSTSYYNNDNKDVKSDSESEEIYNLNKSGLTRTRIQISGDTSESDQSVEYQQQIRIKNKRIKMQQKFKGLLNSRSKSMLSKSVSIEDDKSGNSSDSETSDTEMSSIAKIKKKIKKSMATIQSVCDPNISDEEDNAINTIVAKQRQKKTQKSIKMIEAKPAKMSTKQAMENMQLIKSESNRMLREKAVSLPYHRPKALSLKDVLSKRKPAISSDGKVLPIKMNEDQLKLFALQLEERQKEMMELCKSESDEDYTENSDYIKKHEMVTEIIDSAKEKVENGINNNENEEIIIAQNESDNFASVVIDLPEIKTIADEHQNTNESPINSLNNQNDHEDNDMPLISNDDSVHKENITVENSENTINSFLSINKTFGIVPVNIERKEKEAQGQISESYPEQESQSIHLHYTETNTEDSNVKDSKEIDTPNTGFQQVDIDQDNKQDNFLSDDDIDMEDIDKIIENAVILKDIPEDVTSIYIKKQLDRKPKLIGAPGMVIDLDGTEPMQKRTGVELLKEKFTYFSKLKTPEELEREREKRVKPGAQHLKLKQELEDKIAEQRSLEWAKRLEEEKQHQELGTILDDEDSAEDSTEKIESNLNEHGVNEQSNSESEEELLEDDIIIKDKLRKHNPMVDDEAEESDIDEAGQETDPNQVEVNEGEIDDGEESVEDNDDSSDYDSSESEKEEQLSTVRKGRILKAFEDSDEEDTTNKCAVIEIIKSIENNNEIKADDSNNKEINEVEPSVKCCETTNSLEDDVIQLAQKHASVSEDLFASQESSALNNDDQIRKEDICGDVLGTQTFSISSAKPIDFLCPSQPYHDPNIKAISEGLSQDLLGSQLTVTQVSQSQPISEDILALCTGKFYDNEFVSQNNENENESTMVIIREHISPDNKEVDNTDNARQDILYPEQDNISILNKICPQSENKKDEISDKTKNDSGHILKSILDELDDPDYDKPKLNKFFTGGQNKNSAVGCSQIKKRLVIDSDDETNDANVAAKGKKKKIKKKRLEDRALQISDDEDETEEELLSDEDDNESDLENDNERFVEYDSEENEIEVKPDKPKKKKQATDFFEQEAELTSEDEWVGSGDEDERGLDRMEREEGDDEVFHQGKLRKELGQIHMRDVLDQDKREVRLLQELLFEDGDLGGGHRQRKFRWKNAEDEEIGTVPGEFADTQEEFEFESEEQWRKQRHEREVFLRQMQQKDDDGENFNVTVNRTTIIKANLNSKTMSTLLMEVNQSKIENSGSTVVPEKKTVKDIPSPKKTLSIFQQNYHGSLLTRGRGALARLAALATPLAVDDDTPKISSLAPHKRNFVFAAVTPVDDAPKVTIKRKAVVSTPKLVKKMKIEEKQRNSKTSLLDHFNL